MVDDDPFFDLPVFTAPQQMPEPVPYEVAVRAFAEIIVALKLREKTPRVAEAIPEFKMERRRPRRRPFSTTTGGGDAGAAPHSAFKLRFQPCLFPYRFGS